MRDAAPPSCVSLRRAGYYLYKDKLEFRLDGADGAEVAGVALPRRESKQDPIFGSTYVYHEPFEAVIELRGGGAARTTTWPWTIRAARTRGCAMPR